MRDKEIEQEEIKDTEATDDSTNKEVKKRGKIEVLSNIQINIIATIVFVIFYYFVGTDRYSIRQQLTEDRTILYHQMDSIQQQITKDSTLIEQLRNSDAALEKYVRENFYMHKEGEDIFIIDNVKVE